VETEVKKRRKKSPGGYSTGVRAQIQQFRQQNRALGERFAYTLAILREMKSDLGNSLSSPSTSIVKDPYARFGESSWSIIDRLDLAIEELERGDPRGFEHANEIFSLVRK
jgi:hypothetical protein